MGTDHFIKILTAQDFNGNGIIDIPSSPAPCYDLYISNYYRTGPTGKPSAGIDANGTIYLAYQSVDESSDTVIYQEVHSHSYMSTLPKVSGAYSPFNWSYPFDLTYSMAQGGDGEHQENVLPSITRRVDQYAYVLYQRDYIPGLRTSFCDFYLPDNSYDNEMIVAKVEAGTVGVRPTMAEGVSLFEISPNPAQSKFAVHFSLAKNSNVTISLSDLSGRIVYSSSQQGVSKGFCKHDIETTNLLPGTYVCSVSAEGSVVSKKVIVLPN